jgi:NAD+ kinase
MKAIIVGKNAEQIVDTVKSNGFEIVQANPDFIISFGGDGTLMASETSYPGIPKIVLRDSQICKKCSNLPNEEVLKRIQKGKYVVEEAMKLSAESKGKIIYGINDINVHNLDPRHAIRYTISIDGKQMGGEIIGDGIVLATPSFGSTGYYRSITDSYFEVGIGLAFNNSIEQSDHIVFKEDRVVEINIIRGPASVYADNQRETIELGEGESVTIKKSDQIAKIISV